MSARRIIGTVKDGLLAHDPELGILWVLPDPKREADPEVASALALRNRATLESTCPGCGATEQLRPGAVVMEHEGDCPAATEQLEALIERTRRGQARRGKGGIT